jgi:hypothetical protein
LSKTCFPATCSARSTDQNCGVPWPNPAGAAAATPRMDKANTRTCFMIATEGQAIRAAHRNCYGLASSAAKHKAGIHCGTEPGGLYLLESAREPCMYAREDTYRAASAIAVLRFRSTMRGVSCGNLHLMKRVILILSASAVAGCAQIAPWAVRYQQWAPYDRNGISERQSRRPGYRVRRIDGSGTH